MKGREIMKGAPPTDLLVCFPSRAHLTLMPKPVCSPGRVSSGTDKRRHRRHHSHHHLPSHNHQQKQLQQQQSNNQLVKKQSLKKAQPRPILWVKSKQMGSVGSEPTSPKVTCVGQIKVKSKNSKKPWQSVMEEIERIHGKGQNKKRSGWAGSLGFHKDVVHFLTCLRNLKFNFGCFGSFPVTEVTSTDDEDEDEEDANNNNDDDDPFNNVDKDKNPKTSFSKWFMVLQENNNNSTAKRKGNRRGSSFDEAYLCESLNTTAVPPAPPPPNALLLMRCRSAPARSWLDDERIIDDGNENKGCEEKVVEGESKKLKVLMDEEKKVEEKEERENKKIENDLVLMRYDTEYYKISNDIAKETWVVDGLKDSIWRSRSCKS